MVWGYAQVILKTAQKLLTRHNYLYTQPIHILINIIGLACLYLLYIAKSIFLIYPTLKYLISLFSYSLVFIMNLLVFTTKWRL